jgi:hypothetical protein
VEQTLQRRRRTEGERLMARVKPIGVRFLARQIRDLNTLLCDHAVADYWGGLDRGKLLWSGVSHRGWAKVTQPLNSMTTARAILREVPARKRGKR